MSDRRRSLTDWLLLRAWVEPDHERKLRVVVRRPDPDEEAAPGSESERAFADADAASAYVREWLSGIVARWEAGERYRPRWREGRVKDGRRD